jgi:multisubunit Na+/H+ antiporter MnhF subunit
MYIDLPLMIAIMIALVSSMVALAYSLYLLQSAEQTIDRIISLNRQIRRNNADQTTN